jgi:23S rRNA (guanosine2251-2'-O)-methyltransferase
MATDTKIYGIHAIEALLTQRPEQVQWIWVLDGRQDQRLQKLLTMAKQHSIRVEIKSRQELDRQAAEGNHQGVIAFCQGGKAYEEADLSALIESAKVPLVLALDGVSDPHNLGACLRTADAAGVCAVIAPKDRAVSITPTVQKVACGAAEAVPFIQVTNLARSLQQLQKLGCWVVGLTGEANETLYEIDLKGPIVLVLGAEGDGLRRLTKEHCDFLAKLPMAGTVESLNVSVATGVSLFECVRQRGFTKR